jgi:hypothetical protein
VYRRLHIIVISVVVVAVFSTAIVFISFPFSTAWLLVGLFPAAIIGAILFHVFLPRDLPVLSAEVADRRSVRRAPHGDPELVQYRDVDFDSDEESDEGELHGIWSGTVQVLGAEGLASVIPFRVAVSQLPARAKLLSGSTPVGRSRVSSVDIMEHDGRSRSLYLHINIECDGLSGHQGYMTRLEHVGQSLVPVDATEELTVELHRSDFSVGSVRF